MLIGGDDNSNGVITFGTCFSMLVYICARFRSALIYGNLTAQSPRSHRRIGDRIPIPETLLRALLTFPAPPPESPGELARRLEHCTFYKAPSRATCHSGIPQGCDKMYKETTKKKMPCVPVSFVFSRWALIC